MHHHRDAEPERLAADACLIALNDVLLLEGADTPGDRRGRERDSFGELDLALPAVFQQRSKDGAIQRI